MSGVGRTGSQSTSDKGFPHKLTRERSTHGYSCGARLFPAKSRLLVAALLSASLGSMVTGLCITGRNMTEKNGTLI